MPQRNAALEVLALPINAAVRLTKASMKNPGRLLVRATDDRPGWVVWFGINGKAWPVGVLAIDAHGDSAMTVRGGGLWRRIPWNGKDQEPEGGPNVVLAELSMGRATYAEIRAASHYAVWAVAPDGATRSRAWWTNNDVYDTREDSGYGTPRKSVRSVLRGPGIDYPPGFDTAEPPGPEPDPKPEPGDPPMAKKLLDDVRAERAKYGTPMELHEMGELVNAVAWENRADGWGLAGKSGGARTKQPHTGVEISRDLLLHQPTGRMYDVLSDVAGQAKPAWNDVGPIDMPFVKPVNPTGQDEPGPDPKPEGHHPEYVRAVRDAQAALDRLLL